MIVTLFISLILCVIIYFYIRWTKVKRYWAEKNVPHLPPHPILGSLTFLLKQNPGIWIRQLYDQLRSPYIGIWLFWRPALVITSPDIARRILVVDSEYFRNRLLGSGGTGTDPIGSLNLFTVNEPIWSMVRRRLTAVFTSAKLKMIEPLVITKCCQLLQRIKHEKEKNEPVDVRSLYADMTTDIISISAFGVDGDATLKGKSPMRDVTKELMKFGWYRGLSWASIFFLPEVVDIFRLKVFPKVATDYFHKIFRAAVAQRGGYNKKIVNVKDLLDALLKMKQDSSEDDEEMSEELLLAQAAVFVQGGFDTTAVALTFSTYELAHSPDVQENLYKELLEAKRNLNGKGFDWNTLMQLPYLNGVINETLRKYPPMGWLDRVATTDYEVDKTLKISAGTPVYINACGMHNDPEYFPDPDRFDPERFLPENENKIKPFTFLPFGEGPRHCIGMRFALLTYRHCLATIVLNFELRPFPNSFKPNECPIENKGLLLTPGAKMSVDFVRRD